MTHSHMHFVRLYTLDGYALFAGSLLKGFEKQNLDVTSEWVPESYLRAQRQLDEVLQTRRLPWSLCLRWDYVQRRPIVAYGTLAELPNNQGKLHSVFFIHAVEATSPASIVPLVEGVARQLSPAGIQTLFEGIAEVAAGEREGQFFAKEVSQTLESCCPSNIPPIIFPVDEEINFIVHDRAGSAPIAWLAMSSIHTKKEPPWEVSDYIEPGGQIGTRSRGHDKAQKISLATASSLLLKATEIQDSVVMNDRQTLRDNVKQAITISIKNQDSALQAGEPYSPRLKAEEPSVAMLPVRRIYFTMTLTLLISVLSFFFWLKQADYEDSANQDLQILTGLQQRLGAKIISMERDLSELKAWRVRREGRELIQRVLSREVGAIEEAKKLWEKDPEYFRYFLQEIRKNKNQKQAILDVILYLKVTDTRALIRSQKELRDFLKDVESNGPQTKEGVEAIQDRMGFS